MLFNSLEFCLFFVVVTVLYFALPWRHRWKMLLAASCLFYMAFVPAYILILLITILIDYAMGLKIATAQGRARKTYLVISILATCLVLFAFKYYNFFALSVDQVQRWFGFKASLPLLDIILPIGLSFHTFQSLSYVIEVYYGRQEPVRHFGIYSLYVMFYPQLVAGPIERPQNLLRQFHVEHRFNVTDFAIGMRTIAWGFFLKMVVADRAAAYVNVVYAEWDTSSGLSLLLATLLFAVQIYADFSGYSSIAIGCARVMGMQLMRNFNHPYFAASISEFWQRWHMSLSTWFRDYVYIPLGGSRVDLARHSFNLLVTFTISGLWHGASWNFLIWGAYNGALLVIENFLQLRTRGGISPAVTAVRRAGVLALVCVGWIFFRAPDLESARVIIGRICTDVRFTPADVASTVYLFSRNNAAFAVAATTGFMIALMLAVEWFVERGRAWASPRGESLRYNAMVTVGCFMLIMVFGALQPSAFIYFQF